MTFHDIPIRPPRRAVIVRFCFQLVLLAVVSLFQAHAQLLESYLAQKKSEKQQPNSFLSNDETNDLDQLGRYYRKAFSSQAGRRGFAFGADAATGSLSGPTSQPSAAIPLDGAVNPDEYIVGPMDVFDISIWGDMPASFVQYVTSEGSLIVPTVGEIPVRNLSLRVAKETVVKRIGEKYTKAGASITLLTPRIFSVHVTGVVATPGLVEVTAVDRADRAIAYANMRTETGSTSAATAQPTSEANRIISYSTPPPEPEPLPSLRNVLLFRGRDTLSVDLLRYFATGDLRYNPRLQDGDVLHVPPEALEGNTVSVYGGVRLPGSFEYHPGDSLSTLLRIAQGFKSTAVLDVVQIARLAPGADAYTLIDCDGRRVMERTADIALQPGDRVYVRETRPAAAGRTVTVKGEVAIAGSFPISEGKTTLTQAIAMAGGFTDRASTAEVFILRKNPNLDLDPVRKYPDYERLDEQRLSGMGREEREYFAYESAIRRNTVSLDAARLFVERDGDADVVLRDGDEVIVPTTGNSVYVFGQVRNPGHVAFVAGRDEDYYIERAGGYSDAAVESDTKVIKAGSRDWADPGDTNLLPGDVIFVPRERERDFAFYFTALRDFLTVAVSVVTVYLLLRSN